MRCPNRRSMLVALVTVAVLGLTGCGGADERVIPLPDCLDLAEVYAITGPESIGFRD